MCEIWNQSEDNQKLSGHNNVASSQLFFPLYLEQLNLKHEGRIIQYSLFTLHTFQYNVEFRIFYINK